MLGFGYFVKIAKINSQKKKKQSVIIVKIISRKTQNITFIQKQTSAKINYFVPHAMHYSGITTAGPTR